MSRLPRLLPLVAVAIGGVIAVKAVDSVRELPALVGSARAETAAPASSPAVAASAGGVAAAGRASAARSTRPPPAPVCAPTATELARQAGLSPAELRVLQTLGVRRGQLDAREQALSTQVALLEAASRKLDDRTRALAQVRGQLQGLLGQADTQTQGEVTRLVAVYSNMRPREAAAIFTSLNDAVRLPVAGAMRPQKLALIMAQMPPATARELTEKMARRFAGAQAVAAQARAAMAAPAAPRATPAPSAAAPAASAAASTTAPGTSATAVTTPGVTEAAPAARPQRRASRPQTRRAARPAPSTPAPTTTAETRQIAAVAAPPAAVPVARPAASPAATPRPTAPQAVSPTVARTTPPRPTVAGPAA